MKTTKPTSDAALSLHDAELVALDELQPHPSNYREHTVEQLRHLRRSLDEHGVYRNVVVARDGTILAGHGVVEAARALGLDQLPVVRLDVDPDDEQAIKVLTGDNEVARLAAINDRQLADLLRSLHESSVDALVGTGFDEQMLANLVYVTRPESEIGDRDDAAAWLGLPAYESSVVPLRVVVSFDNDEERKRFLHEIGVAEVHQHNRSVISVWWPAREREDVTSLRFVESDR